LREIPRLLDSVNTPENLGELVQGNAWKEKLKKDDSLDLTPFSFDSILLATNKFSMTSKLGQGGFGSVYKVKPSCRIFDKWIYRYNLMSK